MSCGVNLAPPADWRMLFLEVFFTLWLTESENMCTEWKSQRKAGAFPVGSLVCKHYRLIT